MEARSNGDENYIVDALKTVAACIPSPPLVASASVDDLYGMCRKVCRKVYEKQPLRAMKIVEVYAKLCEYLGYDANDMLFDS